MYNSLRYRHEYILDSSYECIVYTVQCAVYTAIYNLHICIMYILNTINYRLWHILCIVVPIQVEKNVRLIN